MTHREKLLTGAVAAAGVLWFGTQGLTRYRDAVERNEAVKLEAEQALSEAKAAVARGQHARGQLNRWVRQSLPTNREVAESLYQDWLREQLKGAGLEVTQLSENSGSGRAQQYGELAFEIRGTGTLEQLADFLYRFYTAVHLHRISSATISAADGGKKLELTLSVGALVLPDADRTDKLAEGEPRNLPASLEELRSRLVGRNLFVAYSPKADAQAGAAQDEAAAGATFTWTDYSNYGWRMGVKTKDSNEMKYYLQGDDIEIGKIKGKIVEIENRRAVIETDSGRIEVRQGQNFSEATPVQASAA